MKFEDFLMQRSEEKQKRFDLEEEVQVLFSELAMVEEEISRLERKVEELKLRLYQEREHTKEWEVQRRQGQQNHLLC
ncbi:hypothetical protein ACE6H2_014983 [Prunus campanulata]